MNWFNENAGVIILVAAILIVAMLGVTLWLLLQLKSRIAVQKLSFLGMYATSIDTHKTYADFIVGNKTLYTVGVQEIGLKNGKVNFDLTKRYREKAGLPSDAKLVIGQRSSLTLRLTAEELKQAVVVKDGKKLVGTLKCYVVDFAGVLYEGKVKNVRKLLQELVKEEASSARGEAGKK